MKEKLFLTVSKRVWMEYTVAGALSIIVAFLRVWDSLILDCIRLVVMIALIYCLSRVLFSKKEGMDEMAEANLNEAMASASRVLMILFSLIIIVVLLLPEAWTASWPLKDVLISLVYLIMGTFELAVGVMFKRYEEE